jgi:hypothetical protein
VRISRLRFAEDRLQVRWRSSGEQAILRNELKSLQKGFTILLEASLSHFLVTPPSHFTPQKVKGFVVGFTWLRRRTITSKILLSSWAVKGKNVLGTNLGFQIKNENLRLYSRMVLEIRQSLSTGRFQEGSIGTRQSHF